MQPTAGTCDRRGLLQLISMDLMKTLYNQSQLYNLMYIHDIVGMFPIRDPKSQ